MKSLPSYSLLRLAHSELEAKQVVVTELMSQVPVEAESEASCCASPDELNAVATASKTSETSNKRRAAGWPVSSMGDMIYLLVLFLNVARMVGLKARAANEASESLRVGITLHS
jgi:hypothetical protein